MKKVLFLGCSHNQVPYLKAAKDMGFIIIGTDINPDAPGVTFTDVFYPVSYTDVDALTKITIIEGIDREDKIFTAASHFANEAASVIAERVGIPYISPTTVDICLDKTKFYKFLQHFKIPVPQTSLYNPDSPPTIDPNKIYYLKSDYGKSPKYCYRICDGFIPQLPWEFDIFYRKNFLLQDEVRGIHFRLNICPSLVATFLKFDDQAAIPLEVLGIGHDTVVNQLNKVIEALKLENFLVKFDLIVNEEGWYIIDIGLDPPMRLKLFYEFLGFNFAKSYISLYLNGDASDFSKWADLVRPVLIKRDTMGFKIINLVD